MVKPKLIAIVGPTASGKTALGIELAKALGGEIISADSRQVYSGLDIGTGKVTKKEKQGIPHFILDVANPKKQFSVDDFVKLGRKALGEIFKKNKVPIIVGGTGLYVDMLLGRMSYPEVPPNPILRKKLEKKSVVQLFSMLKKFDPRRATNIEKNNPRRLIRAIEIAEAIGKSPSPAEAPGQSPYDILWLGLNPGEKKLGQKIHKRLLSRMHTGMIKEAQSLHKRGLSYKRMGELGLEYRFLALFLQKKLTYEQLEIQLERAIHHYAGRQMRWFKKNPEILWVKSYPQSLKLAKKFVL